MSWFLINCLKEETSARTHKCSSSARLSIANGINVKRWFTCTIIMLFYTWNATNDLIVCKAFVPTNRFNWIALNGARCSKAICCIFFHPVHYDWFVWASLFPFHFQLNRLKYFHYYDLLWLKQQYNHRVHISMFLFANTNHFGILLLLLLSPFFSSIAIKSQVFMIFLFIFHLNLIVIRKTIPLHFWSLPHIVHIICLFSYFFNENSAHHTLSTHWMNESEFS